MVLGRFSWAYAGLRSGVLFPRGSVPMQDSSLKCVVCREKSLKHMEGNVILRAALNARIEHSQDGGSFSASADHGGYSNAFKCLLNVFVGGWGFTVRLFLF